MTKLKETDLYPPVKALLEAQGYDVKAEIGAADVMAVREDEPPVFIELKVRFSLTLLHQAIERLRVSDMVYVAIPEWKGRAGWRAYVQNRKLCRRLGLGIITVSPGLDKAIVQLDPGPYAPRKSKRKTNRMLKEFQHRVGDPNKGGSVKVKLVTAYRQDALRCLKHVSENGPTKASIVAKSVDVLRAREIMSMDHYGWFERVERGIYGITPKGITAISDYAEELEKLA